MNLYLAIGLLIVFIVCLAINNHVGEAISNKNTDLVKVLLRDSDVELSNSERIELEKSTQYSSFYPQLNLWKKIRALRGLPEDLSSEEMKLFTSNGRGYKYIK